MRFSARNREGYPPLPARLGRRHEPLRSAAAGLAVALLWAFLPTGCTVAVTPASTVSGGATLTGPISAENRPVIGEAKGFRWGLSLAYGARLSVYGEHLRIDDWRVEGEPAPETKVNLAGAELGVPLLFPFAFAMDFSETGVMLAHLVELDLGLARGSSGRSRHVGLGVVIDGGPVEFHVRAQYRWLSDLPLATGLAAGRAEVEGWTLQLGLSFPGDLVRLSFRPLSWPVVFM